MLPDGWKNVTLDEITLEQLVGTPLRGSTSDSTLPLLKMGNLLWGALDLRSVEQIDFALTEGQDCRVRSGDILFNTRNTPELVGKTAYWHAPYEAAFDNNIMRIRLLANADPAYVAAWMGSQIGQKAIGQFVCASTSVGAVYWRDLSTMSLLLPPLPEQRRIAAVLDAWDAAISTAERLVEARMRRKCGLSRALFGDGHNPFAVEGSPLEEVASVAYGKGVAETEYQEGGNVWVIGTQGVMGRACRPQQHGPVIIVGRKGTLNRPVYVPPGQGFAAIDTTFILRSSVEQLSRSFFQYLRHIDLAKLNEASGVPSISADTLRSLPIPPLDNRQSEILDECDTETDLADKRLTALRQQKRGLMQILLTGKVRVSASIDRLLPDALPTLVAAE